MTTALTVLYPCILLSFHKLKHALALNICDPTFQNESHWHFLSFWNIYKCTSREHTVLFKMVPKFIKIGFLSCPYNNFKSQPPHRVILRNWQTKFLSNSPQQANACSKKLLMTQKKIVRKGYNFWCKKDLAIWFCRGLFCFLYKISHNK